ncbi:MAG: thermostable hemolysin [Burkholderiales bacterium]
MPMEAASHVRAFGAGRSPPPAVLSRGATARLEPVHRTHPHRASFEQFIAARFHRAYGARVAHFSPHLLGVRDALAQWQASSGYTPAEGQSLFLEQYLDRPIEGSLASGVGRPVAREGIVEVGNLAAVSAGMARTLIPLLARHLHRLGYEWVVFTATRELRNTFRRLGLNPLRLARADPTRLPDGGANWGSYYERDPLVMAGRIVRGMHVPSRT